MRILRGRTGEKGRVILENCRMGNELERKAVHFTYRTLNITSVVVVVVIMMMVMMMTMINKSRSSDDDRPLH
jgi:heme/copper-type cytochrome/quinol oxidase subunit 2